MYPTIPEDDNGRPRGFTRISLYDFNGWLDHWKSHTTDTTDWITINYRRVAEAMGGSPTIAFVEYDRNLPVGMAGVPLRLTRMVQWLEDDQSIRYLTTDDRATSVAFWFAKYTEAALFKLRWEI